MFSLLASIALLPLALAAPVTSPNGKYFVILKPGAYASDVQSTLAGGAIANAEIHHNYEIGNFRGFAASLSSEQISALGKDSTVAYVEPDGIAHTQDAVDEPSAPWGLARVSHRQLGSTDYYYDSSSGAGACAYIIDTGIYTEHSEFEGRASMVHSYTGVNTDDNGHGTHVSGTIGSKTYGIAKKALLFGIKVLDSEGSGAWTDIVAAIQLAVTDSASRAASCPNGFVVNMSLGGSFIQTVNDAVDAAVNSGLFFAVAAGNDGTDYSQTSPASAPGAFAVGASDNTDQLASFSNYGANLGVIAPGVDVLSTWNTADGTNTISGTSMATPHVVGLAAYLVGSKGPMSPATLKSTIQSLATQGAVTLGSSAGSTPNLLAFNGMGS